MGGHIVPPGVLEYDGRYDGPDYTHPFWPRVGIVPPKATLGYMDCCEVCGYTRAGLDLDGQPGEQGSMHATGAGGWPLTVVLWPLGAWEQGEMALTCPQCGSFELSQGVHPGVYGTGPGRTWRMGDPGGTNYVYCHSCTNRIEYGGSK